MNTDITTTGENGGNVAKTEADLYGSLILSAQKGDRNSLSRLEQMGITLEASKGQHFNAAVYLQEKLLHELGSNDREFQQGMRKNVSLLRSDLYRPNASPEVELLAQIVITNWIHWMDLQERYRLGSGAFTEKQDNFFEKKIDQAQKRFLQSIKTSAQVKRLLTKPLIQINVAKQQNVKSA